MDENMKHNQEHEYDEKEHKKRNRKTAEERLAELLRKEEAAKKVAKDRAKAIKALKEKTKYAKFDRLMRRAEAKGLTEEEFWGYVDKVSDALINEALKNKNNHKL